MRLKNSIKSVRNLSDKAEFRQKRKYSSSFWSRHDLIKDIPNHPGFTADQLKLFSSIKEQVFKRDNDIKESEQFYKKSLVLFKPEHFVSAGLLPKYHLSLAMYYAFSAYRSDIEIDTIILQKCSNIHGQSQHQYSLSISDLLSIRATLKCPPKVSSVFSKLSVIVDTLQHEANSNQKSIRSDLIPTNMKKIINHPSYFTASILSAKRSIVFETGVYYCNIIDLLNLYELQRIMSCHSRIACHEKNDIPSKIETLMIKTEVQADILDEKIVNYAQVVEPQQYPTDYRFTPEILENFRQELGIKNIFQKQ